MFFAVSTGFWIAGGLLLVAAGGVTWMLAIDAERKSLADAPDPPGADEEDAAGEPTGRERREVDGYPLRAGAHWSPRYSFHGADRAVRRAVHKRRSKR